MPSAEPTASASFDLVTFDSAHPVALAEFWCGALGLVVDEIEDDGRWIVLATVDGERRLGIQRGTRRVGSVHLDLRCGQDAFDTELRRLLALGAVLMGSPRREPYGTIVNLADPDGNLFDLCAYHG